MGKHHLCETVHYKNYKVPAFPSWLSESLTRPIFSPPLLKCYPLGSAKTFWPMSQHPSPSFQFPVSRFYFNISDFSEILLETSRPASLPLFMPLPILGLSSTSSCVSPPFLKTLTQFLPHLWSFWASLSWNTDLISTDHSRGPGWGPALSTSRSESYFPRVVKGKWWSCCLQLSPSLRACNIN